MATANGFVDRAAELEFILTKTDGQTRCGLLGIKEAHYENNEAARQWHEPLAQEVKACSEDAQKKLEDIYSNMTYNYDE